jgi:hypothetical protein
MLIVIGMCAVKKSTRNSEKLARLIASVIVPIINDTAVHNPILNSYLSIGKLLSNLPRQAFTQVRSEEATRIARLEAVEIADLPNTMFHSTRNTTIVFCYKPYKSEKRSRHSPYWRRYWELGSFAGA